jgi:tetratricopeptide (TPR) repeat protein
MPKASSTRLGTDSQRAAWRRRLWVVGATASVLVISAVPFYLALHPTSARRPARAAAPQYVGSERCKACHEAAYAAWSGSHHARAMQPARDETVSGDFGGATFVHQGKTWRFFRSGQRFLAHAEGPDGVMRDYEVAYTFGVEPLQQYLVAFPGGRLQALSAAWDTRARRWFYVKPGPAAPPGDWLHWTRPGQNWNGMCSDCHSTNVRKGYDPETDTYRTTWSEISVGCEACHGPGSGHVQWAEQPPGRRRVAEDAGLTIRASRLSGPELVALCAPCHARRAQMADQGTPGRELLDRYLPALLSAPAFQPDGQILDEDFEWQSFTQSKMFANGVRCTDCHDVHSGRRHHEGNALCTQCHRAETYDTPAHHFHEVVRDGKPNPGALCVSCHMPGKEFMVVHYRRDHSLRIPRPDLTATLDAPNACSTCHADRPLSWIQAHYDSWFGRKKTPHYGATLGDGRRLTPEAVPGLVHLAEDPVRPAVVRATAVELLAGYPDPTARAAVEHALADGEPLVRATAAARLGERNPADLARLLAPLLEDPVQQVRTQAAARLAGEPAQWLSEPGRRAHTRALAEYVEGQRYASDLPSGPFNLGNLAAAEGHIDVAERQYRRALEIDDAFDQARSNLATMVAGQGRLDEAEGLLRRVLARHPRDAGVSFNLGLLVAERGRTDEAERLLRSALEADPRLAPAAINLAVLVGERNPAEAVDLARRAAALEPEAPRDAWTLGYYQARAGDLQGAAKTLEALVRSHPEYADGYNLLAQVYDRLGRGGDAAALLQRRPTTAH